MIRNPYAQKLPSPSPSGSKKRPRPREGWQLNQQARLPHNHHHCGSRDNRSDAADGSKNEISIPTSGGHDDDEGHRTINNNDNDKDSNSDDPFDVGIDWSAAIPHLDEATTITSSSTASDPAHSIKSSATAAATTTTTATAMTRTTTSNNPTSSPSLLPLPLRTLNGGNTPRVVRGATAAKNCSSNNSYRPITTSVATRNPYSKNASASKATKTSTSNHFQYNNKGTTTTNVATDNRPMVQSSSVAAKAKNPYCGNTTNNTNRPTSQTGRPLVPLPPNTTTVSTTNGCSTTDLNNNNIFQNKKESIASSIANNSSGRSTTQSSPFTVKNPYYNNNTNNSNRPTSQRFCPPTVLPPNTTPISSSGYSSSQLSPKLNNSNNFRNNKEGTAVHVANINRPTTQPNQVYCNSNTNSSNRPSSQTGRPLVALPPNKTTVPTTNGYSTTELNNTIFQNNEECTAFGIASNDNRPMTKSSAFIAKNPYCSNNTNNNNRPSSQMGRAAVALGHSTAIASNAYSASPLPSELNNNNKDFRNSKEGRASIVNGRPKTKQSNPVVPRNSYSDTNINPLKRESKNCYSKSLPLPGLHDKVNKNTEGTAATANVRPMEQSNPVAAVDLSSTVRTGIPPSFRSKAAQSNTVASLRPPSWTATAVPQPKIKVGPHSSIPLNAMSIADATSAKAIVDPWQTSLPPCLQFDPKSVRPVKDDYTKILITNANVSAPLLNGWKLYSHQKKAITQGLLKRRYILALDMGLGKTIVGCVWAKAFQASFPNCKIIIICPVSLKKDWQKTATEATGLRMQEKSDKGRDICDNTTDVFISSWAKVPSEPLTAHYVVVCDEAHSMQSMQTARTKSTLKLVKSKCCVGVLLLTGTPMKNGKTSNLFPLLKAVGHPFGCHQKAYEAQFCDGHEHSFGKGRTVWMASGSSNLEQLRKLTESHVLYLTKDECLTLPPKTRSTHRVPVSSRFELLYKKAMEKLCLVYEASRAIENGEDGVMGELQKVRNLGSLAKVDAAVKLAKEVLEKEPAVVIFTAFVAVAKAVHKQLAEAGWGGELLTGETAPKKRHALVQNFQDGLSPSFVATFGAGGVGLTLTAACTVILLDRPWTPGDTFQAEDRVRRIGQTKPVRSIWVSAFDLDEQIDDMIKQKTETSTAVLSDGRGGPASGPKISIYQLLKKLLPHYGKSGL